MASNYTPIGTSKPTATQLETYKNPQKTPLVTSAPAAISPKPAVIAPPQTSSSTLSTPAAQQFMESQTTPPTSGTSSAAGTGITASATPSKGNDNAYLTYLRTMFNPDEVKKVQKETEARSKQVADATKALNDLQTRAFKQELESRKLYNNTLNASGGTRTGAENSAALVARNSNSSLADLAVAQNAQANTLSSLTAARQAAVDTYNRYIDAGKTVYEAEEAAKKAEQDTQYTLGKDQIRYGADGKIIAGNVGDDTEDNTLLSPSEAQTLGVPYGTTRSQAAGQGITPEKPLTESQARDVTYGTRGQEADSILKSMESAVAGYNPVTYAAYSKIEPSTIGNSFVPDDIRQIKQAERNFLTAVLRRESGAQIAPSEMATGEKQYFPRPGDDAKTLAQKAQNRATAISSFLQNARQGSNSNSSGTGIIQSKVGAINTNW